MNESFDSTDALYEHCPFAYNHTAQYIEVHIYAYGDSSLPNYKGSFHKADPFENECY